MKYSVEQIKKWLDGGEVVSREVTLDLLKELQSIRTYKEVGEVADWLAKGEAVSPHVLAQLLAENALLNEKIKIIEKDEFCMNRTEMLRLREENSRFRTALGKITLEGVGVWERRLASDALEGT